MIGIGSIVKLARGALTPDEMGEVLTAVGIEATFTDVKPELSTFGALVASSSLPGSMLSELKGRMKNGHRFHALLVISPETCDSRHKLSS